MLNERTDMGQINAESGRPQQLTHSDICPSFVIVCERVLCIFTNTNVVTNSVQEKNNFPLGLKAKKRHAFSSNLLNTLATCITGYTAGPTLDHCAGHGKDTDIILATGHTRII